MKKIIQSIPRKIWGLGVVSIVCLLFIGILTVGEKQMQKNLYDQQMANRWSKEEDTAQISVFFAKGQAGDIEYFKGIGQQIDTALKEASITNENENARLWIAGISQSGKVTLSSQRAEVELNAYGVSGEFFQFHPQKLVTGALFHQDSMMQDGVVIDEETAWQLFGSSDVAGMQVMINEVPHFITGVVERSRGRLAAAAGLDTSLCFLSLESLQKYGNPTGEFCYEIVLPNPIDNFAVSIVNTAVGAEQEGRSVIENSTRYQFLSLMNIIKNFGIRSMSFQGIVYPYWENIGRGYEDIFALFLLIKVILFIIPCIFITILIIYLWKRKQWTMGQIVMKIKDRIYDMSVLREKKKRRRQE